MKAGSKFSLTRRREPGMPVPATLKRRYFFPSTTHDFKARLGVALA